MPWTMLAWALAPARPVVETARPDASAGWFGWIALGIGIASLVLIVAARRRARRRGEPVGLRSMRGGGAVGNALLDLGSILQPDRPDAAVIRRLDEEGEHDHAGDGRRPRGG